MNRLVTKTGFAALFAIGLIACDDGSTLDPQLDEQGAASETEVLGQIGTSPFPGFPGRPDGGGFPGGGRFPGGGGLPGAGRPGSGFPGATPPAEPPATDTPATADAGVTAPSEPSAGGTEPKRSSGCGKPKPGTDNRITVGTKTGTYILDVPPSYDSNKAYPLVFVWHGAGVKNTAFHGYLNVQAVAGNEAIIVTPETLSGSSNWPQDMAYFDTMLEHFSASYCVDESRVFSAGHSMGGMFTANLGCQRANKLRGNAVLAAPHARGQCVSGNMAQMFVVGKSDRIANANTEIDWYASANKCDASKVTPAQPAGCSDYGGCTTPFRACTFNGGHEIPNWVAGAVWSFFKSL
jgi:polyhydroxybutyrate depolymerase